jgi:hypothetical protein
MSCLNSLVEKESAIQGPLLNPFDFFIIIFTAPLCHKIRARYPK